MISAIAAASPRDVRCALDGLRARLAARGGSGRELRLRGRGLELGDAALGDGRPGPRLVEFATGASEQALGLDVLAAAPLLDLLAPPGELLVPGVDLRARLGERLRRPVGRRLRPLALQLELVLASEKVPLALAQGVARLFQVPPDPLGLRDGLLALGLELLGARGGSLTLGVELRGPTRELLRAAVELSRGPPSPAQGAWICAQPASPAVSPARPRRPAQRCQEGSRAHAPGVRHAPPGRSRSDRVRSDPSPTGRSRPGARAPWW